MALPGWLEATEERVASAARRSGLPGTETDASRPRHGSTGDVSARRIARSLLRVRGPLNAHARSGRGFFIEKRTARHHNPLPGPASTSRGPSVWSTASCCASVKLARKVCVITRFYKIVLLLLSS